MLFKPALLALVALSAISLAYPQGPRTTNTAKQRNNIPVDAQGQPKLTPEQVQQAMQHLHHVQDPMPNWTGEPVVQGNNGKMYIPGVGDWEPPAGVLDGPGHGTTPQRPTKPVRPAPPVPAHPPTHEHEEHEDEDDEDHEVHEKHHHFKDFLHKIGDLFHHHHHEDDSSSSSN